jgi:hypothetical protein
VSRSHPAPSPRRTRRCAARSRHVARPIPPEPPLQQQAGGDPLIGRRLRPLIAAAGFSDIAVSPRTVDVDADHPDLAEGFTRRTFIAMVAGVREPAIAAGLTTVGLHL